jgi:hypothetical protein
MGLLTVDAGSIVRLILLTLWAIALNTVPANAQVEPQSRFSFIDSDLGPVLTFLDADIAVHSSEQPPLAGWQRRPLGFGVSYEEFGRNASTHVMWVRMRVDRAALAAGPLSVFTADNRDRFTLFVNGEQIYTNFVPGTTNTARWYRPDIVPLPPALLREGSNEFLARIESNYDLVSGRFHVGPSRVLDTRMAWQSFWRVQGVQAANIIMILLAGGALVLWFYRRQDIEMLALGLLGIAWLSRNYVYLFTQAPIDIVLFKSIAIYASIPAALMTSIFCLVVAQGNKWQFHVRLLGAAGVVIFGFFS